jgi:L-2-hydroxyglutarate oxidase LhgO
MWRKERDIRTMDLEANGHDRVEVAVIGAGVVGLAVARALALAGREVIVLEAARTIGSGTSSRNSEVIHGGIYYPPGSLKARLCVAGRTALYAYCRERAIRHARLGKLIVACDHNEIAKLRHLKENAARNGVHDLVLLDARAARSMEPELACSAALLSPSTGIVDVHELMLSYQGDIENCGGTIVFGAEVTAGRIEEQGVTLLVDQDGGTVLACRKVVNCAGLAAQTVAASIDGFPAAAIPRRHLAKGNYFKLARRSPFARLIYPLPCDGGAGIHLTLDHAGQARFGPDVQWVDEIDYRISGERLPVFEAAIRSYWPGLPSGALSPDYCGIRPKLHGQGDKHADFMMQDGGQFGARGLINLYGIESPGLTASLSIGAYVRDLLDDEDATCRRVARRQGRQLSPEEGNDAAGR